MNENNDLLQKINHAYNNLSKGKKRLANYILNYYDKAAFMTASKLGKTVEVSESTVVRFAYTLGYDGYPDLQHRLQELIRNKLTSVQRIQLAFDLDQNEILRTVLKSDMNNLRETNEVIDNATFNEIVKAIGKAKNIYIVGLRSSSLLAQFLGYYLGFMLDNVKVMNASMSGVLEHLIPISEDDLCIGISFPRYSTRTVEAMKFAKARNATLVAITDSVTSRIAQIATYSLIARSNMVSFADSLVAPLSVINALIVAVSVSQRDKISSRLAQLEHIWGSQSEYITEN